LRLIALPRIFALNCPGGLTSRPLPIHPAGEAEVEAVPRRTVLQALATGLGSAFALPSAAQAQHPVYRHLSNPGVIDQARQQAAGRTRAFLDAHQGRTLDALAEAIVPGSTQARVGAFLDRLLAVDSAEHQRDFVGALGAFDMAAIAKHDRPWIRISPSEQDALLQEASTADATSSPIRDHFENLKEWIAGAYYSSEIGMRELGWTGNVFHPSLPGCTHRDGHGD
jgi:hypothetical protein